MLDFLAGSPIPGLPTEIAYLLLSVALLFVHINLQSVLMTRQLGSDYNASPRDEDRQVTGVAARAERALRNFNESFAGAAALMLAVTATDQASWWTGFGAALYFWARVVYIPLYLTGVLYWRSIVFMVSLAGMVIMFFSVIF